MKRLLLISAALCSLLSLKAQTSQDPQAAQKAWMDYMTPGKVHEMMAKSDGSWTFEMTSWMEPGGKPSISTGTTENKMILGGRYQESINKCTMEGMEFEGHNLTGYDNAKKTFVSSWVDNMGTGIMNMEGKWDDATKSITFYGTCVNPVTGKDMKIKQVITFVDNDHETMEMYMDEGGKEFKNMEIKSTRK